MKLGIFVSDYKPTAQILERIEADKLGIILVLNGVYHAVLKEEGKESGLLARTPHVYALSEDLATRGLTADQVDKRVKVVNYDGLVDVMFNEFEQLAWV